MSVKNLWQQTVKGLDEEQSFESPGTIGEVTVDIGYVYFVGGKNAAIECYFPIEDIEDPTPVRKKAQAAAKKDGVSAKKVQRVLRVLMHRDSAFNSRTGQKVEWEGNRGEVFPLWTVSTSKGTSWDDLEPSAAKLQMELLGEMGFSIKEYGDTFWGRVERRPDPYFVHKGEKTETYEDDEGNEKQAYKRIEVLTERFASQKEAMDRLNELASDDAEMSLSPWKDWPGIAFEPGDVEADIDEILAVINGEDEMDYEGDYRAYATQLWDAGEGDGDAERWVARALSYADHNPKEIAKLLKLNVKKVIEYTATE